ncbi:MAG TPA: cache domain-containing protein, partial [Spirochaetota bacterium]
MKSIRVRMLLLFGISTIVLLGLLSAVLVVVVNRTFIPFAESSSKMVVQARSDQIGTLIGGYIQEVDALSRLDAFSSGKIADARKYFASNKNPINPDFNYLVYAIPSGDMVTGLLKDTNASDRDYFKEIMIDGKSFAVSAPLISKTTGQKMFIVAHAVKNSSGDVVGLIGASVKLETLSTIAAALKIGEKGYGWIADGTGLIIAHPNKDFVMQLQLLTSSEKGFKGLEEAGKKMIEGKSETTRIIRPDGASSVLSFSPIPNTPHWSLGVTVPESDFLVQGRSLMRMMGIAIFIILVLLSGVIVLISNYIVRPLTVSTDYLVQIGRGDFTHEIRSDLLGKKDEI